MKNQKTFFYLSFLPALAYWYLEENYSLQTALLGGLFLAVLEMGIEWIFTRHIHTISKLNFALILILGSMALLANEGIWFKLQPSFTGWIVGAYLLWRAVKKNSLMLEMLQQMPAKKIPAPILEFAERNLAIFMIAYGSFMAFIAVWTDTGQWLFWKTAGFYLATAAFTVMQVVLIRMKMKRLIHERS